MDCYPRKANIMQPTAKVDALDCRSNKNTRGRCSVLHFDFDLHHEPVVCPKPQRVACPSFVSDDLYRFCCKPRSNHKGQEEPSPGLNSVDLFLSTNGCKEDAEPNSPASYFCGSPPVRTSNPLVRDEQFNRQTLTRPTSVLSHGGKPIVRVEGFATSCGASIGAKPKVRIEGFVSSSPESQCIVPALA
ncbi:uncharacterized protein LOC18434534 [Amborella trichopoda]|uniref:Uncharacterized protein n=1 Tax=Amborella trichopoda TaxID=13333 RepID=W1PGW5_AMBTC|nr:uncharacterized protein LOC18434534 [Amborella trichopoda]ERN06340.1 hypothetical protein AMTR_s00016p00240970 [Amborella trichopoda]|eukprot:XP_006844665.1 uncharacterized protein LOC18434534 [Amborella trichopoda]